MIEVLVAILTVALAAVHGRRIACAAPRGDAVPVRVAVLHAVAFCGLGATGALATPAAPIVLGALLLSLLPVAVPVPPPPPAAIAVAGASDGGERARRSLAAIASLRAGIDALLHERRGAVGRRAALQRMRADAARLEDCLAEPLAALVPTGAVEVSTVALPELVDDALRGARAAAPDLDASAVVDGEVPRLIETDARLLRAALGALLGAARGVAARRAEIVVAVRGDELALGVVAPSDRSLALDDADRRRLVAGLEQLGGRIGAARRGAMRGLEVVVPLFPAPESEAMWVPGRVRGGAQTSTPPCDGALLRRRVLVVAQGGGGGLRIDPAATLLAAGAEVDAVASVAEARSLVALDPRAHECVVLTGSPAELARAARELRQLGVRAPLLSPSTVDPHRPPPGDEVVHLGADLDGEGLLREVARRIATARAGADDDGAESVASRLAFDRRFAPLVERFLAAVPGLLEELDESRRSGDRERALRLGRQLVHSGARYGFDRVSERAASLVRAIAAAEPDERVEAAVVGLARALGATLGPGARPRVPPGRAPATA